jgi:hypothetical protein
MPGLDPGIHDFLPRQVAKEDVDGRDKPGHDAIVSVSLQTLAKLFT